MVKVKTPKGTFDYEVSNKPDRKLMTTVNGKVIHFGASGYQHYHDKTGLLPKSLNHEDPKRRAAYLARAGAIRDKSGKLAAEDITSANYHAINILW